MPKEKKLEKLRIDDSPIPESPIDARRRANTDATKFKKIKDQTSFKDDDSNESVKSSKDNRHSLAVSKSKTQLPIVNVAFLPPKISSTTSPGESNSTSVSPRAPNHPLPPLPPQLASPSPYSTPTMSPHSHTPPPTLPQHISGVPFTLPSHPSHISPTILPPTSNQLPVTSDEYNNDNVAPESYELINPTDIPSHDTETQLQTVSPPPPPLPPKQPLYSQLSCPPVSQQQQQQQQLPPQQKLNKPPPVKPKPSSLRKSLSSLNETK